MDLATSTGICLVGLGLFIAWVYIKDALSAHDKRKAEENAEKMARHPFLTQLIGGIIAWKAFEIWNRSRMSNDGTRRSSRSDDGRSVYDDLNMK